MRRKEWHLLQLAGEWSGVGEDGFAVSRALGVDPDEAHSAAWNSTLNDDGSPLELCITIREDDCRYRLIADPEPGLPDPADRLAAGEKALAAAIGMGQADALAPFFERAVRDWIPGKDEPVQLTREPMWVAVGLHSPGVAVYLDGRIGSTASAWERAKNWAQVLLRQIGSPADEVNAYLDTVKPYARLGSVGLEGTTPENARLKFYWRLLQPVRIDALRLPFLSDPSFPAFMRIMAGARSDQGFSRSGLIFSTGFSLTKGEAVDAKLDICGCPKCLRLSPEEWISRLTEACRTWNLALPPVEEALRTHRCAGILLGLGLDFKKRHRLNFYLKPAGQSTE